MHSRTANDPPNHLAAEINAVLDWWREAGVDCLFDEAPRHWLVAPEPGAPNVASTPGDKIRPPQAPRQPAPPPSSPLPPPSRAMIGGDPAGWPQALADFAPWWLSESSLDLGQPRGRVPPRGASDAALMVLVAEPEAGDDDKLLSGPQGELLAAMLSAMGLTADQVYFASALPRHTPMPDWADLAAHGLGEVVRRHIVLARPQRAIAFGRHVSGLLNPAGLALPQRVNDSAQTLSIYPVLSHAAISVPLLVTRDLGSLLARPIAKGAFWQQWLEWSAGE